MTLYWSAAGGAENDMTPYTRIIHVREAFGVATILINIYATCVYATVFDNPDFESYLFKLPL